MKVLLIYSRTMIRNDETVVRLNRDVFILGLLASSSGIIIMGWFCIGNTATLNKFLLSSTGKCVGARQSGFFNGCENV